MQPLHAIDEHFGSSLAVLFPRGHGGALTWAPTSMPACAFWSSHLQVLVHACNSELNSLGEFRFLETVLYWAVLPSMRFLRKPLNMLLLY